VTPFDTAHVNRHLASYEASRAKLTAAKARGDLEEERSAAFEAARESLKAAAARFGIPHDGRGGLLDLSEKLSGTIGAGCLPSRLASVLFLDPAVKDLQIPPARLAKALAKAEEIAINLARVAKEGPADGQ
jgi:hypothetical protein